MLQTVVELRAVGRRLLVTELVAGYAQDGDRELIFQQLL